MSHSYLVLFIHISYLFSIVSSRFIDVFAMTICQSVSMVTGMQRHNLCQLPVSIDNYLTIFHFSIFFSKLFCLFANFLLFLKNVPFGLYPCGRLMFAILFKSIGIPGRTLFETSAGCKSGNRFSQVSLDFEWGIIKLLFVDKWK